MKIGVMVESFRTDFRSAIEKAASLGANGVQAYATTGFIGVDEADCARLNEALDIVRSNGMVFSAICGDFDVGFADAEKNKIYVDKSKRVLELAKKLDCNIVTTHIGHIPTEECETKEIMRAACRELALYADSIGSVFAVETGTETATVLRDFLESLGANGVRVNFDPANLVMVAGDKAEDDVPVLGKYIVHTHAKDGIKLDNKTEADVAAGLITEAQLRVAKDGYPFMEVPLGTGHVDFDKYLAALAAVPYDGFLTVEREVGDNPEADIRLAVDFLRSKIG